MRALLIVTLLLGSGLSATGCGPAPYVDRHYAAVPEMPPEPYDEEIPAPPGDGYTWISGYWYWDGGAYIWQPGYWTLPPAANQVWVRSGWVHHGGSYRFVRGYWAPRRHVVTYHYVRPAPRAIYHRPHYRAVPRQRPAPRQRPTPRRR